MALNSRKLQNITFNIYPYILDISARVCVMAIHDLIKIEFVYN